MTNTLVVILTISFKKGIKCCSYDCEVTKNAKRYNKTL